MANPSSTVRPRVDPDVAHRLRSPANLLSLALEIHQRGDAAQQAEALRLLRRGTDQLIALIDELSGQATPSPSTARDQQALPPPGTRVLVVEDEYLLAQTVKRCLAQAGCEVLGPVATVEEALELIDGLRASCAVVDANLDGEFTTAVVDSLAEHGIASGVLSGYDQAALPAGLQRLPFLQKPVVASELLQLVARLSAPDTSAPT